MASFYVVTVSDDGAPTNVQTITADTEQAAATAYGNSWGAVGLVAVIAAGDVAAFRLTPTVQVSTSTLPA